MGTFSQIELNSFRGQELRLAKKINESFGNPNTNLSAGINVSITGIGTVGNPYVINCTVSGGSGSVDSVAGKVGIVTLDTNDVSTVTNKNYVTDAQLVLLSNLSGTNTGDQNLSTLLVKNNNLSDLTNTTTARANLGLGSLATQGGTFSGTSSGTNTGDETTSRINILYGYTPANASIVATNTSNIATNTSDIVLKANLISPSFTTPVLGIASVTSINKLTITTPASGSTLTIIDGKTFTSSNTLTLAGTDSSTLNIGAGGTLGSFAYLNEATRNAETITQTSHGFASAQVVKKTGATWALALADNSGNAEALGIIESVTTNTFLIVTAGKITLSGLTQGSTYFLSPTTAGLLTTTEPSAVGQISKPILDARSTTDAQVINMRGAQIIAPLAPLTTPIFVTNITTPIVWGSSAASGNLTIASTSDSTKGFTNIGNNTTFTVDEVNKRIGMGTAAPANKIDITDSVAGLVRLLMVNTSSGTTSQSLFQASNGTSALQAGVVSTGYTTVAGVLANDAYIQITHASANLHVKTSGTGDLIFDLNATEKFRMKNSGAFGIGVASPAAQLDTAQTVTTSGSTKLILFTGAAHTGQTASTELTDINFNLSRTLQFATGAITTQRVVRIQAPTYGFVGASTITTASTLAISGAPVAGTNATLTNSYALNIESGASIFAGLTTFTAGTIDSTLTSGRVVIVGTSGRIQDNGSLTYDTSTGILSMVGIAITGGKLPITGNVTGASVGLAGTGLSRTAWTYTNNTTATSGTVTHTAAHSLNAVTFAASNTGVTYTSGSNLYIDAPVAGTNITLTNSYSLYTVGSIATEANLKLLTAGSGIYIKEGSNATMGTGTLVGGIATISTTKITTNSRIFICRTTANGTLGDLGEDSTARVNATSFAVKSMTLGASGTLNVLDTSSFVWFFIEPS